MSESDYEKIVVTHYGREEVQEEIARFSRRRWVAVQCESLNPQGYQVLLRYQRASGKVKVPLVITKPPEIPDLIKRFQRLRPRAFYASVNAYRELTRAEQVKDLSNIISCMPTWDVDNVPEKWEATIAAAREIIDSLSAEGISKSVFLKWSGKGVHVHIHDGAFSETFLKGINPLDAAYAVVESVNRQLLGKYAKIAQLYQAPELEIENEMDLQRVFTCPLSLHRSLNRIAVCFSASSIDDFNPEWSALEHYRHWKGWDNFELGEADELGEKAYRAVGKYPFQKRTRISVTKKKARQNLITNWLEKERL